MGVRLLAIGVMDALRGRLLQEQGTDVNGIPYLLVRLELYIPGDPPGVLATDIRLVR